MVARSGEIQKQIQIQDNDLFQFIVARLRENTDLRVCPSLLRPPTYRTEHQWECGFISHAIIIAQIISIARLKTNLRNLLMMDDGDDVGGRSDDGDNGDDGGDGDDGDDDD